MSRLGSILTPIFALLIVLPLAALAQAPPPPGPSPVGARVLGRLHEAGADVPPLRLLFYQEDSGEACVGLGIKEGPTPLRPGFLVFQARSEGGKGKPQRLKFEFDKDRVKTEEGLRMWTSCLPEEEADVGPGDEIQITVRRPRRETQAFVVKFPPPGMSNGIDLWQEHDGRLKSFDRSASLGG
jgi:hypothetical protein